MVSVDYNSLNPGICGSNFTSVFFKLTVWMDYLSSSCEIGRRRMPQNPTDKSDNIGSAIGLALYDNKSLLSHSWSRSFLLYGH